MVITGTVYDCYTSITEILSCLNNHFSRFHAGLIWLFDAILLYKSIETPVLWLAPASQALLRVRKPGFGGVRIG